MTFDRRSLFLGGTAVVALGAAGFLFRRPDATIAAEGTFPLTMTEDEWKKKLAPDVFEVLRHENTERPGSSPLLNEHRVGIFNCAGCAQKLFDSKTKFESGTGWPSFYQPLANAVGENTDNTFGMTRTEVHCSNCGGHLGHVFDDGPQPTGLRYCMNGLALTFTPNA